METIKELAKNAIKSVINDYGETRTTEYHEDTNTASIILNNGWVVSIIRPDFGADNKHWSVAVCDYNGYFDWNVLKPFGTEKSPNALGDHKMIDTGCILCDTEERVVQIIKAIQAFKPLSYPM
jgi:hypothetical protein